MKSLRSRGSSAVVVSWFTRDRSQVRNPPRPSSRRPAKAGFLRCRASRRAMRGRAYGSAMETSGSRAVPFLMDGPTCTPCARSASTRELVRRSSRGIDDQPRAASRRRRFAGTWVTVAGTPAGEDERTVLERADSHGAGLLRVIWRCGHRSEAASYPAKSRTGRASSSASSNGNERSHMFMWAG